MPPDAGADGEARGAGSQVAVCWGSCRSIGRKCAFCNDFAGSVLTFLSLTTAKWLIFLRGLRESGSFFCGRPIDMFGNIVYYIRKIEERYGF